jgi:dihydrofolate reductase
MRRASWKGDPVVDLETGRSSYRRLIMRKLVASSFVTLDGISEDPAGFEGSEAGGWSLPFFDDEAASSAHELLLASDVFLCGRRTYEGFAKFGPAMTGEYAETLNGMPKLVVSTTLEEPLEWNAKIIRGDVVSEVSNLKGQPGQNIVTYGGGELMQALMRADLVDQYKIWLFPLVLGSGKSLFQEGVDRAALRLVDAKQLRSGVVIMTYEPSKLNSTT